MITLLFMLVVGATDLQCGEWDEWNGPPAQCACVDLVNSPGDDDE